MFAVFVRRPVLATVVNLLILLFGIKALSLLELRQYPKMSETTISVSTSFAGADPELMQSFVTAPIQRAVAAVEGIDYVQSSSSQGFSQVRMLLRLGEDPDAAMASVTAKVAEARYLLPDGVDDPIVSKWSDDSFAAMYLSFYSPDLTQAQITDYVARVIQPWLIAIPGVANPDLWGGRNIALRIWLDPQRMAAYGLSAEDVRRAIEANNVQATAGSAKGVFDVVGTSARTDLRDPADFETLVVATREGGLVRLRDVADVRLGSEESESSVYAAGERAVFVGIQIQPGANPLEVVDSVMAQVPAIEKRLPPGMRMEAAYDNTVFIRAAIDEVLFGMAEAAAVVVVVMFLFMGSVRSVLVPLVTIPLSIVGVGVLLLALGFSLNLLTLLAMVLAIGLVVDDAIVVVENVHRHILMGKRPFDAAIVGIREIAVPVVTMSVTLAAVYAPVAVASGFTGALFQEFALTLAGAVLISGFVALTLSPVMCSRILKNGAEHGFAGALDRLFDRARALYRRALVVLLADRAPTLVFALIVCGTLVYLFDATDLELAPPEDQGEIYFAYSGPDTANIDYMDLNTEGLHDRLAAIPEVRNTWWINGDDGPSVGFGGVALAPWHERTRTQEEIVPEIQAILDAMPGVQGWVFGASALQGDNDIEVGILNIGDARLLDQVATALKERAEASGLFTYVDLDLAYDKLRTVVEVDRDKAAAYGVTMEAIAETFSVMTGGGDVNLMNLQNRSYPVIPQVPRAFRLNPEMFGGYYVKTASGKAVPLSGIVTVRRVLEPDVLSEHNQQNAVWMELGKAEGVTVADAVEALAAIADDVLPTGFAYDFKGDARRYVQEGDTLLVTFGFALAVIFLVLAAQFESFRDPLVIMVSVPLSICGALVPLALGYATLNIYSQFGLITLVGLITKHGILICAVAREKQEEGLTRAEAVLEAATLRLRPILMTTAAMIAGLLPLLISTGAGAASRFSIAIVIVAGMAVGTAFTLFVLPVVYTLLAADRRPSADAALPQAAA